MEIKACTSFNPYLGSFQNLACCHLSSRQSTDPLAIQVLNSYLQQPWPFLIHKNETYTKYTVGWQNGVMSWDSQKPSVLFSQVNYETEEVISTKTEHKQSIISPWKFSKWLLAMSYSILTKKRVLGLVNDVNLQTAIFKKQTFIILAHLKCYDWSLVHLGCQKQKAFYVTILYTKMSYNQTCLTGDSSIDFPVFPECLNDCLIAANQLSFSQYIYTFPAQTLLSVLGRK